MLIMDKRNVSFCGIRDVCLSDVVSCEAEDRLLTELFDTRQYRRLSRPVRRVADVVIVELGLVIKKVVELVSTPS